MVECHLAGLPWEVICAWDASEFTEMYHSIKRIEARKQLGMMSLISQSMHGDEESQKKFTEHTSQWLPKCESGAAPTGVDDSDALMNALKGSNSMRKSK